MEREAGGGGGGGEENEPRTLPLCLSFVRYDD